MDQLNFSFNDSIDGNNCFFLNNSRNFRFSGFWAEIQYKFLKIKSRNRKIAKMSFSKFCISKSVRLVITNNTQKYIITQKSFPWPRKLILILKMTVKGVKIRKIENFGFYFEFCRDLRWIFLKNRSISFLVCVWASFLDF